MSSIIIINYFLRLTEIELISIKDNAVTLLFHL